MRGGRMYLMFFFWYAPLLFLMAFICIPHGEKQDKTTASDCKISCYKYLIYR